MARSKPTKKTAATKRKLNDEQKAAKADYEKRRRRRWSVLRKACALDELCGSPIFVYVGGEQHNFAYSSEPISDTWPPPSSVLLDNKVTTIVFGKDKQVAKGRRNTTPKLYSEASTSRQVRAQAAAEFVSKMEAYVARCQRPAVDRTIEILRDYL